ncbi:hypothetical protein BDV59DRAFT_54424 [Aspergillus ambiguus]|uniref:uncharacterized protein n=1 Tax=Aspergillus ambiguus TaxID=176160 RepID=UPI003CCCA46B
MRRPSQEHLHHAVFTSFSVTTCSDTHHITPYSRMINVPMPTTARKKNSPTISSFTPSERLPNIFS